MDLTIAMQVLKATVSFASSLEQGKTRAGSRFSKHKSQVKINSQQLQPKRVTASSYSGMQFTSFKTQNGRLAAWPQAQAHRNTTKLATDYER